MANDNNKIKNLVSNAEDENLPTLESEATDSEPAEAALNASEAASTMQSELRASESSIDRLLFDLEHLRAHRTGLDKELKARVVLTDRVNSDLRMVRADLDQRNSQLESLKSELAAEKSQHDLSQDQLHDLRCAVEELEQRLQDSEARSLPDIDAESLRRELLESEGRLAAIEAANQQLSDEISAAHHHHLHSGTSAAAGSSTGADEAGASGTTDRRVADKEESRKLKDQNTRTEKYADGLRIKLRNQIEVSTESLIAQQQLELSLETALAQARDLKTELENKTRAAKEMSGRLETQQKAFDEELRTVRFELGGAQETLAEHQTVGEQLTSDLIDNQGFQQALEQQLSTTARQSETAIRELDRRLKQKFRSNEELQRKLEHKDNAIAALLSELAKRGNATETPHAAIVERKKESADHLSESGTGQRVTRLLVGTINGQKLRFPLFKDRLTIGRTAHNDIQLKAQFVSRRHAVIVSDNGVTRIVDWGSRNGVMVNRERINEKFLNNGDIVVIGTTEFRYTERSKR